MQKGSLPQLKQLIHCTTNLDPTKNMRGCEDSLTTVLHAHVISAAKEILSDETVCYTDVTALSREIVTRFLSFDPDVSSNKCIVMLCRYYILDYCGMVLMMPSKKAMETEF